MNFSFGVTDSAKRGSDSGRSLLSGQLIILDLYAILGSRFCLSDSSIYVAIFDLGFSAEDWLHFGFET
jgi:hypothetical protein